MKGIDCRKIESAADKVAVALNDFSVKLEDLMERTPTTKKEVTAIKGRLTLYTNKTLRAIKYMKVVIDRELDKVAKVVAELEKSNKLEAEDEKQTI